MLLLSSILSHIVFTPGNYTVTLCLSSLIPHRIIARRAFRSCATLFEAWRMTCCSCLLVHSCTSVIRCAARLVWQARDCQVRLYREAMLDGTRKRFPTNNSCDRMLPCCSLVSFMSLEQFLTVALPQLRPPCSPRRVKALANMRRSAVKVKEGKLPPSATSALHRRLAYAARRAPSARFTRRQQSYHVSPVCRCFLLPTSPL